MFQLSPKQPDPEPLLVDGRDAAKLLAISERTLFSLTKSGAIPAVYVGRCKRYDPNDLRRWIEQAKGR